MNKLHLQPNIPSSFRMILAWLAILLLLGPLNWNGAFAQTNALEFSQVSDTLIIGRSPSLGIKFTAARKINNETLSLQLGANKTIVLSRKRGQMSFYLTSQQTETGTEVVAQDSEVVAIAALALALRQYQAQRQWGYYTLGNTLLDGLLVLSNWPHGMPLMNVPVTGPVNGVEIVR